MDDGIQGMWRLLDYCRPGFIQECNLVWVQACTSWARNLSLILFYLILYSLSTGFQISLQSKYNIKVARKSAYGFSITYPTMIYFRILVLSVAHNWVSFLQIAGIRQGSWLSLDDIRWGRVLGFNLDRMLLSAAILMIVLQPTSDTWEI